MIPFGQRFFLTAFFAAGFFEAGFFETAFFAGAFLVGVFAFDGVAFFVTAGFFFEGAAFFAGLTGFFAAFAALFFTPGELDTFSPDVAFTTSPASPPSQLHPLELLLQQHLSACAHASLSLQQQWEQRQPLQPEPCHVPALAPEAEAEAEAHTVSGS